MGYVRIAHVTHGWGPYAAMRLSVALRAMSLRDDMAPFGRTAVGCIHGSDPATAARFQR